MTKLATLKPDARNANKGTERGRKLVRESLKRYGAGRSILLDKSGNIIAGNKTVEAAGTVGMEDVQIVKSDGTRLVAVQRTDLDINSKAARELAIADNRASEVGLEWDVEVLKEFAAEEIDLSPFWDEREMQGVFGLEPEDAPEPKLDQAAALQKKWKTKLGQLWLIGPHRLLCGDAKLDVGKLFGKIKPALLLTDPPYGIGIVKGMRIGSSQPQPLGFKGSSGDSKPFGSTHGDCKKAIVVKAREYTPIEGDYEPFDPIPLIGLCEAHVIFGANHFATKLPESAAWIVWDKGVAEGCSFSGAELAWTDVGEHVRMYRHTWSGLVREGPRDIELVDRVHPTQKPVGLFKQILEEFSKSDDVVADLYLGSGSVMVACQLTTASATP